VFTYIGGRSNIPAEGAEAHRVTIPRLLGDSVRGQQVASEVVQRTAFIIRQ
jgi:hypothetical protein